MADAASTVHKAYRPTFDRARLSGGSPSRLRCRKASIPTRASNRLVVPRPCWAATLAR